MCKILLSIKPEHVKNIMDGKKIFEFRKVDCKRDVSHIMIYSTYPVMKVIGKAPVRRKLVCSPDEMWEKTHGGAGIDHEFFNKYYEGHEKAIAFELENVEAFDQPVSLKEYGIRQAPQSFMYMAN